MLKALLMKLTALNLRAVFVKGRETAPLFTAASVVFGVFLYFDEAAERRDDRLIAAWQLLSTPANGNTGKIGALEVLVAAGQPLVGIDLGCIPEPYHETRMICRRGVYLDGVRLSDANLTNATFEGADLRAADFSRATLHRTTFTRADLTGAQMANAALTNAILPGASVEGVVFDGTDLSATSFRTAHVSGADFRNATGLETALFHNAWAWDDNPPRGLPDDQIRLCDSAERTDRDYVDRFAAPRGCPRLSP